MLLVNLTLQEYVIATLCLFFIILIDSILTNINARLSGVDYSTVEMLPWVKYSYRINNMLGALVLSASISMLLTVGMFFMPFSISIVLVLLGFWMYRLWNSLYRTYVYYRGSR